jgi:hypothetical protein
MAELADYATPTQLRYLKAVEEHGGVRAAERALGLGNDTIGAALRALKRKAALRCYAPAHDMDHPVPEPLVLKGTSTLYDKDGEVRLQWVKTKLDDQMRAEMIREAFAVMADELPRLEPVAAPVLSLRAELLCTLVTFTDFHLGMLARKAETGGDWNVEKAEAVLFSAFAHLIRNAPPAATLVLNVQGDFFHSDRLEPTTPTSGHVLDQDGSYAFMVAVGIRVLRRLCALALETHETVRVIFAEGNHDLASSVWLRQMFAALYENEPRLSVDSSELPYYVHRHGKVMLAFHHGHLKKNDQLPLLFAASFPEVWGATTKRYCHTGHRHHVEEKEHAGMTVVQHPTLAARDAYAARGGWISERQATAISYHAEFGQVARTTVTPEMLEAA